MFWRDSDFYAERQEDRNKNFIRIGEKVFSFFQDKAVEAGFQERDGQLEMACDIVDGIRDKKHVLVEAGVGIGKSFAYIVPILFYHEKYLLPVVIATSTIALQEQLSHDIDTITKMLDMEVEVLIAKGQNHFLCKDRFNEYFTEAVINKNETNEEIYYSICNGGHEKSDWSMSISDKIWNNINVKEFNQKYCKEQCSNRVRCHYYQLRQQMQITRGIVICNQDLLAANMHKRSMDYQQMINPNLELIVIDEVHNLENKVRASVTDTIGVPAIRKIIDAVSKAASEFDSLFSRRIQKAHKLLDIVFYDFEKQMTAQDEDNKKAGQEIERYHVDCNSDNISKLKNVISEISFTASIQFGDYEGDRHRIKYDAEIEKMEEYENFLKSMCETESDDIFWLERKAKGINGIRLFRCPKAVNKLTQRILFDDPKITTILTSATITSGKDEDYINNYRYFINNTAFPYKKSIIVEPQISPFNYDEHTKIYYTEDLPHPTKEREAFINEGVKEIIKLLEISNGKALILFTAKTDMEEVYQRLKNENLPYELLMQRGNSKQAELLEKFRKNVNSVLLGTGTFWEGINIEGMSLSHLIVFKLPFPVREPIIDYKWSISKNGLMEVSVPEMVLKLKQGIGRLIRSETDKGIVSIIDSRVGDKSRVQYKDIIWNSLPIKKRTNDIAEIEAFYRTVVEGNEM